MRECVSAREARAMDNAHNTSLSTAFTSTNFRFLNHVIPSNHLAYHPSSGVQLDTQIRSVTRPLLSSPDVESIHQIHDLAHTHSLVYEKLNSQFPLSFNH